MTPIDVLVIGGGPAGAMSAHLLAKQGFTVTLLDAATEVKRKVCGEYLCPQGVELLKKQGLYEMFQDKFLPVTGMDLFSPSGLKVESHFYSDKGIQIGMSLNRQIFDKALLDQARLSGVDVRFGSKVVTIEKQMDLWTVETLKGEKIVARLIVGADGRQSFVAKHFAVQRPANPKRVALHCYLTTSTSHSRQGEMHLFDNGSYVGIDPITDTEINFSLVCDAEDVKRAGGAREALNRCLQKSDNLRQRFGVISPETKVFAVSPVHNYVNSIAGQGWCLVGDASGFVDPLTGEGIYNAMLTAELLAEELGAERSRSLQHWNLALPRYARRRKKLLRAKSRLNSGFQWLIAQPKLVNLIARFLSRRQAKADVFIGIVGNIYSPMSGLIKLLSV